MRKINYTIFLFFYFFINTVFFCCCNKWGGETPKPERQKEGLQHNTDIRFAKLAEFRGQKELSRSSKPT